METIEPKYRILLCLEQPSLTYTRTHSVLRSHHCCFAILNLKLFKIKLQKDYFFIFDPIFFSNKKHVGIETSMV